MIRSHLFAGIAPVLAVAVLPALCSNSARSDPVPKDKPAIRLTLAGEMKLAELRVEDAAVIDDNTVVLVGTKNGPEDADPDKLDPNGAIVDLIRKKARPFTNGHKARIGSVSVARGRVATASNSRDPVLRIWDLKANKSVAAIEIDKPGEEVIHYGVAWFHKSDRIAIAAGKRVIVVNPVKPDDRTEFACPPEGGRWLEEHPVVSPDDAWLACAADLHQVVYWKMATRKATALSLVPKKAKPEDSWHSGGVAFGPAGTLIAWRSESGAGEVPEKEAEKDVPADRRGVVQIDLSKGRLVPLGMGQSIYTLSCAIDPTGTWLATGGTGWLDRPQPDAKTGSELRVYHLSSGKLAFRAQKDSLPLKWVSFTPSGKRVVCATYDGVVRWWDMPK
jgi:WD40 repeat protein